MPDFTILAGATSPPVDLFSFLLGLGAAPNTAYVADAFLQDPSLFSALA